MRSFDSINNILLSLIFSSNEWLIHCYPISTRRNSQEYLDGRPSRDFPLCITPASLALRVHRQPPRAPNSCDRPRRPPCQQRWAYRAAKSTVQWLTVTHQPSLASQDASKQVLQATVRLAGRILHVACIKRQGSPKSLSVQIKSVRSKTFDQNNQCF